MTDKQLILTADDFGRGAAVNAAIEEWHRAGAITHAGLMVNEPGAEEAVEIARRNPNLRIGLHLTLCDGRASDGRVMGASPTLAGLRFAFFPGARAWLRREISAQFEKFRALGFAPSHWDGHTHLHLHPVVLAIMIPIAGGHGFRFTRLVREPRDGKRPRGFLPRVFSILSARAVPKLQAVGIGFADAVFGLSKSGRMDLDEVRRATKCARTRLTEIYFHPGAEALLTNPDEVTRIIVQLP